MIKRMTPVKLSNSSKQAVQKQLGTQEIIRATPKSTDPKHFPVFTVPTNEKRLIYVPAHITVLEDGTEELRMDKPLIHSIIDGNRFLSYRCISGLEVTDDDGNVIMSGTCPLCDAASEPWDLAREVIASQCAQQGLDPEDKDNNQVKSIRSTAFSDRVLKEANRYYTFPIVVVDTVDNDGKTLKKDENGNVLCTPMWYHISESQYQDKWLKILESLEDEPTHPGGHFFILDYTYTPKNGEPNKRDSARNLTVKGKVFKNSEKLRARLDKATEGWTPEKAQEVVISNQLFSEADLQEVADSALENTRNMLALYRAKSSGTTGFNLEKAQDAPLSIGSSSANNNTIVPMDDTDEDDSDLDLG